MSDICRGIESFDEIKNEKTIEQKVKQLARELGFRARVEKDLGQKKNGSILMSTWETIFDKFDPNSETSIYT